MCGARGGGGSKPPPYGGDWVYTVGDGALDVPHHREASITQNRNLRYLRGLERRVGRQGYSTWAPTPTVFYWGKSIAAVLR